MSVHAAVDIAVRTAIPIRDILAPENRRAMTRAAQSAPRVADRRYAGVDISALSFSMRQAGLHQMTPHGRRNYEFVTLNKHSFSERLFIIHAFKRVLPCARSRL